MPAAQPSCDACGIVGVRRELSPVPVTPRAPDVGALLLCRACRTGPRRAWRWRWTPTDPV
jgi:hypothetical protein